MKNKILRVFLAFVVALPMFTSVLAVSSSDLLARLDEIMADVNAIKQEYSEVVDAYPEVVASLSAESKQTIEDLSNGQVLAEDMAARVEALKSELSLSEVEGAGEILSAVEEAEDTAKTIIADNKDIVEEVKTGYTDMTVQEIQQVVEKVVEVLEQLGASTDVTATYNFMMDTLDNAHEIALEINDNLEEILANNVEIFEDCLSMELVKELLKEIKAKDIEAVISTLRTAVGKTEGAAELKQQLVELKDLAVDLKDELMGLTTLTEQELLMFTEEQRADVAAKLKEVEKDYIDFAKVVLDSYVQDYMQVVIDAAYNVSVDQMIDYANTALDYFVKYKGTIKELASTAKDYVLQHFPYELAKKAGVVVALGFVDVSDYNKQYITDNFGTQIEDMANYLAQELLNYLEHIDTTLNDEIDEAYAIEVSETAQNALRSVTAARFNTLTNLKALKSRVDSEILSKLEVESEAMEEILNYVYDMYNDNIMDSIGATLLKENQDENKKYECLDEQGFIVTNKFWTLNEFNAEIGIPTANKNVVTYSNAANSAIKTGTTFAIELSEDVVGELSLAVLGDTYADGRIDARDYMVIKNRIMEDEELSEAALLAADTYRDGAIDARDYMKIKNFIMEDAEISL